MPRFVGAWTAAWRVHAFKKEAVYSIVTLIVALVAMGGFLLQNEARVGVVFADPILGLFPPVDVHWIVYSIIYSAALFGLVSLSMYPFALLLTVRALIVLIVLHIACLFLLPLDPPTGIIPLSDPFLLFLGIRVTNVRELFFAWPAGMLALLAITAQWKDLKVIFSVAAAVVSVLLLVQHAHYTIDVVAAPVFAYAAAGIARWRTVGDVGTVAVPKPSPTGNAARI